MRPSRSLLIRKLIVRDCSGAGEDVGQDDQQEQQGEEEEEQPAAPKRRRVKVRASTIRADLAWQTVSSVALPLCSRLVQYSE